MFKGLRGNKGQGTRDKGRGSRDGKKWEESCRDKWRGREDMARFEELEVWKRAARLSADLYKYFRSSKDYGFRDQITRA